MPPSSPADLLQGSLTLLILQTLRDGRQHGWGIAQRIQSRSRDLLTVNQGSLYPALHKLERQGWIEAEWGVSENNRRARFYRLTAQGRRALVQESRAWEQFVQAVQWVLHPTGAA